MAKNAASYKFEKRKKEIARQKKQEEKRQRLLQKKQEKDGTTDGAAPDGTPALPSVDDASGLVKEDDAETAA